MTEQTPVTESEERLLVESDTVRLGIVRSTLGKLGLLGGGREAYEPQETAPSTIDALRAIDNSNGPVRLESDDDRAKQLLASYVAGPRLARPMYLRPGATIGEYQKVASIQPPDSGPTYLPVANFISAPRFSDWTGTGPRKLGNGFNGASAKSVIRRYAGIKDMPPIGTVFAFTQPNGLTLLQLTGDGSNRLAAAVARGDEYIATNYSIQACEIPENIVPLSPGGQELSAND